MATIAHNKQTWDGTYDWSHQGDEWSTAWGGPDMQWYGTILPRIHAFVPTGTILEIAPGYGRWTQFLKDLCDQLILVDLSSTCINACQKRFKDCSSITYYVNDGKSLEMVTDHSIDFVFSFDSLVHAEEDVMQAYVSQLAQKLNQNGVGVLHHSNIGSYALYFRLINRFPTLRRYLVKCRLVEPTDYWRAYSMTGEKFRTYLAEVGLHCLNQELINWGAKRLIDCISVFTRKDSVWVRPFTLARNPRFMQEASQVARLSSLYGIRTFGTPGQRQKEG